MAAGKLKIDIRRKKILDLLQHDGQVMVSKLSQLLDATPVTIRNDLNALEQDGFLRRVQGGAVLTARTLHGWEHNPQADEALAAIKQSLATRAAAHIRDGSTLFINSGSTMCFFAAALKQRRNLNIVTNSLSVAMELGQTPSFRVLLLGGEINTQYAFTCGGDAQEQLRRYQADWAVLSVDGIGASEGLSTYHADEAIINRTMIERAGRSMIVADHNKIGHAGFTFITAAGPNQTLVTDRIGDPDAVNQLEALGLEIIDG